MAIIKVALLLVAGLLILAIILVVISSLLSLDWSRTHRAATNQLPELDAMRGDGLARVSANGYEFRARVAGRGNSGPALLLLHGFPVTSAMYTPLIDAAAAAGYRVVAFDQRGYSPGARPTDLQAYKLPHLVADALGVADAVDFDRFHVVAHDWGSAVGWMLALQHSDRLLSYTSLSIPHVAAFQAGLIDDPDQRRRSRYMIFFRMPWLPELTFTFNRLGLLRSALYTQMPEAERTEYLSVFAEPGAMTAALNWYRAPTDAEDVASVADPMLKIPFLFIWGNQDGAVSRNSVDGQRPFIEGEYRELELDAGHWLMEERSDVVVPEILSFLEGSRLVQQQ
jgi:pimeloyl-ACP methyl ester carboxylesterase